jgi:hypothetical protein
MFIRDMVLPPQKYKSCKKEIPAAHKNDKPSPYKGYSYQ